MLRLKRRMSGKEGVGKYGMNAEVNEKWKGKEGVGKSERSAEGKGLVHGEKKRDWGHNCEVGR